MLDRNVQPVGTKYQTPDFLAIARAYGIAAEAPASVDEAAKSIAKAMAANVPALIELTPEVFGATASTIEILDASASCVE